MAAPLLKPPAFRRTERGDCPFGNPVSGLRLRSPDGPCCRPWAAQTKTAPAMWGGRSVLVCREGLSEAEVFRGDGRSQPNTIVCAPERQPVYMHCSGVHPQHHGATVPGANLHGGFFIWRQVDVLATARIEAARENRIEVVARRAMEKRGRWLDGRQAQIDGNGMSLGGANTAAVFREREPLLVVVRNDLSEGIGGKSMPCPFHAAQELVHLDPSAGAKREPD